MAVSSALETGGTITVPPLRPGSPLFSDGIDDGEELEFVRFYVTDSTEGLLLLPDGRELRVNVLATDTTGAPDGKFDLSLILNPEQREQLQNIEDLRRYLTLDKSAWRWCRQQTEPSLYGQDEFPPKVGQPSEDDNVPDLNSTVIFDAYIAPHNFRSFASQPRHNEVFDPAPAPPAPTSDFVRPTAVWDVVLPPLNGIVTVLHRQRWPNGIVTEQCERRPEK